MRDPHINPEWARSEIDRIRDMDDEDAHIAEDKMRAEVLLAIASGAPNPRELAEAALESSKLDFSRWYS